MEKKDASAKAKKGPHRWMHLGAGQGAGSVGPSSDPLDKSTAELTPELGVDVRPEPATIHDLEIERERRRKK